MTVCDAQAAPTILALHLPLCVGNGVLIPKQQLLNCSTAQLLNCSTATIYPRLMVPPEYPRLATYLCLYAPFAGLFPFHIFTGTRHTSTACSLTSRVGNRTVTGALVMALISMLGGAAAS